ncbi:MAG: MFS transporter [Chitinophagaceae bacterium]
MNKKERIIVILLASLNFTHLLDFVIMMPLGNYLMPQLSITPFQFTLLIGAYPISAFFSGILLATHADKFERKKFLLLTYTGFIIGTAACGFANGFIFLLSARIITGFFGGIIGGQVLSIVSDLFEFERRGTAMGIVMSAFAVASSAGVTFSLYLVDIFHDNWHLPFLLVAGIGLVLFPFCLRHLPELRDHLHHQVVENRTPAGRIFGILRNRRYSASLLFSGMLMMGHFLIIPFINPYLEFNKGYSKGITPLLFLVGGIASFVSAIMIGKLSDKIGKLTVLNYCIIISFVFVILLTNLPLLPFSVVLLFFTVWFGLVTGRTVSSQTLISSVPDPSSRAGFMSLNSSVQHLGTGAAVLLSGIIVKENKNGKLLRYEWVGYLSIVVLLIVFFLGLRLFRKADRQQTPGA